MKKHSPKSVHAVETNRGREKESLHTVRHESVSVVACEPGVALPYDAAHGAISLARLRATPANTRLPPEAFLG